MAYQIFIEKNAIKQLKHISRQDLPAIKAGISSLAENPRPYGYIKLKGEEAYRIRIGNYRIIYEIYDNVLIVKVVAVAHRKDVYK